MEVSFFPFSQKKTGWKKLFELVKGKSTHDNIHDELNKMQEEVMRENYYEKNKCGEPELERDWELELIRLLEQIKDGFVVRKSSL